MHNLVGLSLTFLTLFALTASSSQLELAEIHYECPHDYTLFASGDEQWCYFLHSPVIADHGLDFDDAVSVCQERGDSLPILTSKTANLNILTFIATKTDGKVWIGIVCDNETDNWTWQDGRTVGYNAFPEDVDNATCSASIRFALLWKGWWKAYDPNVTFRYSVCARRAQPSLPSPSVCPDGMFLSTPSTGWCYLQGNVAPQDEGTFNGAEEYCSVEPYYAQFPSINSAEENEALVGLGSTKPIWIGLKCGENGNWYWANGEPFGEYTNFKAGDGDPHHCDPERDFGHILNDDNEWEDGNGKTVRNYICTKRAKSDIENDDVIGLPTWGIVAISVSSLLILATIISIIVIIRRRFQSLNSEIVEVVRIHQGPKRVDSQPSIIPFGNDKWEIERSCVSIGMTKLGEGAFGSVYLGRILAKNLPAGAGRSIAELTAMNNNNDYVAVKMLHENADKQTEIAFRAEIELMKAIGHHERLEHQDLIDDPKTITEKMQIMFAIQIAYGLEYLSSRGFIHRDIAARNIMVDQQETCKIGDFGLCRAVGGEEENYVSQGGRLPLKWMAPEAIRDYYFSVNSDVWSYGVLMYEIVTLGGTPYAGWPASELLTRLKRGERMDKPDNCSESLYEIMTDCWAELPSDRPSIAMLRKRLGDIAENVFQEYYLKLEAQMNYNVTE